MDETAVAEYIRNTTKSVPGALDAFLSKIGGLNVLFGNVLTRAMRGDPPGLFHRALQYIFASEDGFKLLSSEEVLPLLLAGITHQHEAVRELVVDCLKHWLHDEKRVLFLVASEIFPALVNCINDASVSVASAADRGLQQVCVQQPAAARRLFGLQALFTSEGQVAAEPAARLLYRLRGLTLYVHLAGISDDFWALFLEAGLLKAWMGTLGGAELRADPLMLLNYLELGQKLVAIPTAFKDLPITELVNGVIAVLPAEPTQGNADVFDSIIRCGVVNFLEGFAAAAQGHGWDQWAQLPALLPVLRYHLHRSDDPTLQVASINAIATIGCSQSGLALVGELVPLIAPVVWCTNEEQKTSALNALAAMFACHSDLDGEEAAAILHGAWKAIAPGAAMTYGKGSSLGLVLKLAKLPIAEIAEPALRVLLGITHHSWGLDHMCSEPGYVEYLLDRRSTLGKRANELQFSIIECALKHPAASTHIPVHTRAQMQAFSKAGVVAPVTKAALTEAV